MFKTNKKWFQILFQKFKSLLSESDNENDTEYGSESGASNPENYYSNEQNLSKMNNISWLDNAKIRYGLIKL